MNKELKSSYGLRLVTFGIGVEWGGGGGSRSPESLKCFPKPHHFSACSPYIILL